MALTARAAGLVAVCLVASTVDAATLRGRVEDYAGGRIAGADVVVACPGDARTTESDAQGLFEVHGLPAARCGVSASHADFASTMVEVVLVEGTVVEAHLVLPIQTFQEGVVVTPARGAREPVAAVPSGISIVAARDLALRPYQVLPQALREEPGISVQQTTAAAGSPIVRGFTGQQNVYLLDGVRFNTAAWRSGPSQYSAWLGGAAIERVEVVRGPMSVPYGSDALGGVINVLHARPAFSASGTIVSGAFEAALGSADSSRGIDGAVTVRTPSVAFAAGASRKQVADLRAGGGKDSRAAVTRFLGLAPAAGDGRLGGTGYTQWGARVSGQARLGREAVLSAFYRRDEQDGVNRYDRIAGGEGLYRSEIAPQQLDFSVLRYERAAAGPIDGLRASFSVNRQADGTLEQARPGARVDSERTALTALGYQVQGGRNFGGHSATAGAEIYDERIDAARWQTAATTVAIRPLIPDGTRYTSAGLFAQAVTTELAGRISLRGGIRYNGYRYVSKDAPVFGLSGESIGFSAVTFNTAAAVTLARGLRATVSIGRGFRAANMSDLGAIGLGGGGGFEISPSTAAELGAIVGSTDGADALPTGKRAGLKPESEMAYEAGLRYARAALSLSLAAFDLELYDAITRRALLFTVPVVGVVISGQEVVRQDAEGRAYIALDPRPIVTRANSSRARVRGLDAEGRVLFARRWSGRAWFSMADGRDLETGAYMRRMAPAMGGVAAAWQRSAEGLRVEGVLTFARPQARLAPGDLADARIGGRRTASTIADFFNGAAADQGLVRNGILLATGETLAQVQARLLDGAAVSYVTTREPGWAALGARAIVPVRRGVDLVLVAENLADRNYRLIGSGVDAPGRNVQARARVRF